MMQEPDSAFLALSMMLSSKMEASDPGMVLLAALHSKLSLAYMLTAAPNCQNLPVIEGVEWDLAYGFSCHERRVVEEPLLMTPARVGKTNAGHPKPAQCVFAPCSRMRSCR